MATVDVVMLTKNSARMLNACLKSVYENVPVNRLIVIDGFSTDGTLKILDEFNKKHGNVKLIIENSSRGKARERGIQEVETEWFAFVDSDVILCKDWFRKASRHIQKDVGAVWGVDIPGDVRNRFMIKILQYMETRVFNIRGGCHDILIRHDTVKDIRIPSELHVLEDAYIKEWIARKNYRVIASQDSYCKHYKTMNSLISKENRLSTVFELKNMKFMKERLVYAPLLTILWLLQEVGSRNEKRCPM